MRIGVISKADETGGGASIVAVNLARRYNEKSHEAEHINLTRNRESNPYGAAAPLVSAFKAVEGRLGYRDHTPVEIWTGHLNRLVRNYDVFHLHDMSTVYSHAAIGWLARRRPLVWTIHDCSPFTAGCLYPTGCEGFLTTCGNCPHLRSWPLSTRHDRTATLHHRRRKVLASAPITFTAPSRWMIEQFKRAGYAENRIRFVANGVDTGIFSPSPERAEMRRAHGLDHGRPVICFSAAWLHDTRKGAELVVEFCTRLRDLRPTLLLVGRYGPEAARVFQDLDILHFGFVLDDAERARIFAMADVGLMMSGQENAPLIVLEYLACGTPVFGLPAGGVPDMVVNDETGYVAGDGGLDELEAAFRGAWPDRLARLSRNARSHAERHNGYDVVAGQFLSMFETMRNQRA